MEEVRRRIKEMELGKGEEREKEEKRDEKKEIERKVKELERWKEMEERERRRRNIVIKGDGQGRLERRGEKAAERDRSTGRDRRN